MPDIYPFNRPLLRLDGLIKDLGWLWRPQPFKLRRPDWCRQLPELTEALLQLTEIELTTLSNDHTTLIGWLTAYLPELEPLIELCELTPHSTTTLEDPGPHFSSAIPGRKLRQIELFAAAVGPIDNPITEWCGGKGHLGRRLAAGWNQSITTLEHDEALCSSGAKLAERAKINQRFYKVDVLSPDSDSHLPQKHAVALHACGDLHRTLIRKAVSAKSPAIDLVPCCYHLGKDEQYPPFTGGLQLILNRDALRLAVTETVTSASREIKWRDQEMAWKLGYEQLRQMISGSDQYQSMKPINKRWLREGFEAFCNNIAHRDGLDLHSEIDWSHYQQLGWQRQQEVMRLSLLRNAFRRPLELWLVLDIAEYLSTHGYSVAMGTFCTRATTPRNILISARKRYP